MTGASREPMGRITSIKLKLGLLVAVSVTVAAVLSTLNAGVVPALLGIPVTVLLALGVTQLLAVGMTSPLRQMTEAVRRMAAGDYAVRVDTDSTDEVGELARAFNRMAADLGTVDRQRRDLVASVSHELRTPLTALVGVLENLDDGVTSPDPATIRVALRQAERLGSLVEDLLDLSRVDAGVATLDRSDVPLGDLLDAVVEELASGPRGVAFEVRVEPPPLTAYADPARLHQLLANLLDNAARHGPAGGTVRVWAGRVDGGTRIEVADQGTGIAATDRDRVFERYGTLRDPAGGGTGLGLAIARWVTDLHGGRVAVVDPLAGETGARFRVELPPAVPAPVPAPTPAPTPVSTRHAAAPPTPIPERPSMSTPTSPTSTAPGPSRPVTPPSLMDAAFGDVWPERAVPPRRGVLLGCLAIGVLAGLTLPYARPGLAASLVLLASGALVQWLSPHRRSPFTWACAALAGAFAVVVSVRDASWVTVLGLLVSALLVTTALTRGRSVLGMCLGALTWPLAGLRGIPWLGRSLRAFGVGNRTAAVLRTAGFSLLGVLVFGALFASGDAIVGQWVGAVVPDLRGSVLLRVFVMLAVAGVVLAAAYLALNPPGVEAPAVHRPAQHRFEWLAPVLLVDAVFVVFLAAQAAAVFGGHDYVQRVTGLTYAQYVHQGFAQLTVATVLTLLVVWAAARKAGARHDDRWWLRGALGALCLFTLVVVASALHRMDLYQEAYGFTRLRVLVDLFEGWLGLVVVAVMAAGVAMRGWWLPRAAVLSAAGLFLALAVVNPDAWIARHNIERYETTGKVDWYYLSGLSADAVPTLAALPPQDAACALPDSPAYDDAWTAWNLGRSRADSARRDLVLPTDVDCSGVSGGATPRD